MAATIAGSRTEKSANVVSLFDETHRMKAKGDMGMSGTAERRLEARQASESRLFVQITACADTDLIGTTFSCHTQDVSAGGLRILSEAHVPQGAKLDLWVENALRPGKYFLTSDVRWVETLDTGDCSMGLVLQESPTTDIELWRMDH